MAGLLPGPDINPWFFRWVVPGPRFPHTVPATLAPINYMSCNHIVTWSIHRLYRNIRPFTFRIQNGDPSSGRWVALKQSLISGEIAWFMIVTTRISVWSQICTREVKERLILHNAGIDYVTIRSEFRYLIGAKVVRLKCWVFGGKTGPISMVGVFLW